MLNRKHRFHGYGTLQRIYTHSQSVRGELVGLKFSQRKPDKDYRVAVVVAKKVSKSAVKRNRIRRRIYEVIRNSSAPEKGFDYIFTVYSEQVIDLAQPELTNQIEELILKSKQKSS